MIAIVTPLPVEDDPLSEFLKELDPVDAPLWPSGLDPFETHSGQADVFAGESQNTTTLCEGKTISITEAPSGINGSTLSTNSRTSRSIGPEVGLTLAPSSEMKPYDPLLPSSMSVPVNLALTPLTMNHALPTFGFQKNATVIGLFSDLQLFNSSITSSGDATLFLFTGHLLDFGFTTLSRETIAATMQRWVATVFAPPCMARESSEGVSGRTPSPAKFSLRELFTGMPSIPLHSHEFDSLPHSPCHQEAN